MAEIPILFSGEMVKAILNGRKRMTRRVIKPQPDDAWLRPDNSFYHPEGGETDGLRYGNDVFPAVSPYGKAGDRLYVKETWQYYNWTEDGDPIIRYAADDDRKLVDGHPEEWWDRLDQEFISLSAPYNYDIDGRACDHKWRPSIFMPKWASRIWLEVVDVEVERIQDISEEDAKAEGAKWTTWHQPHGKSEGESIAFAFNGAYPRSTYKAGFANLWDSINAKPKPCYATNDNGEKHIHHYVSYPWEDITETITCRGKPWHVIGNPWVWVVEFKRAEGGLRC